MCVLRAITQVMAMAQLWRQAVISAKRMRVPRAVYLAAEVTIARARVMQATTALRTRKRLLAVVRARLAGTRLLAEMVTRILCALSAKPMRVPRAVYLAAEATPARARVMQATTALRARKRL